MSNRMSRRRKPVRRRGGLLDLLNGVFSLALFGLLLVGGAFLYVAHTFYSASPVAEDSTFLVEPGSSLGLTAERLESRGLIDNRFIFQFGGWALKKQGQVKAGEFRIAKGASMADVLRELTEGTPVQYFVTVPEGETSFQVARRINDPSQNLTGDAVSVPPEGSILPGRYDYFPRDTRQSVLAKMQTKMETELARVWESCEPAVCGAQGPLKSESDLVTLASIVEKETGLAAERPEVAGLFVNRLRQGMRLQTDPTIIYGITKGERSLEGGITASQKAAETAYNTYVISGLPPTPIANPGIEALQAAANPSRTGNIYMMAVTPGKPSDGHLFAATLQEHQANEAKYRAQERAQARAATGQGTPANATGSVSTGTPAPANTR